MSLTRFIAQYGSRSVSQSVSQSVSRCVSDCDGDPYLVASRLAVIRRCVVVAESIDMTGGLTSAASRRTYYTKVAAASFLIGASMELFMIRTGFYEKVTSIEAEERRERLRAQQQLSLSNES